MSRLTRRLFLQSTALTAAALPLASRRRLVAAPGEKLNLASVGVGGKGWSDLLAITASPNVNVVAICDIDESKDHLGRAAEKFPKAERYTDWRKLLDQKGIDAVHIATPDHMHAPVALAAIKRGKPVYCQKPLTHTVLEARTLTVAANRADLVTQMGNQIQSHDFYRTAVQVVHDGTIGKVKEVYSWQSGTPQWPRGIDRPAGADTIPAYVHWDNWLGTAPVRPYKTGIYHPFNWRGWQDFSNGQLGDFGCHILDPVFMALALTSPLTIRAAAPANNKDSWTKSATVAYEFPGTKYTQGQTIKVTWVDGEGILPARELLPVPADFKLPGSGSVLIGDQGTLVIPHVAAPRLFPTEKFANFKFPELPKRDHYVSWVDACLGNDKTTSNFSYSGPLTEAVLLGAIAIRLAGETLNWNAAEMKITNSTEANQLLTKDYRKGWELS